MFTHFLLLSWRTSMRVFILALISLFSLWFSGWFWYILVRRCFYIPLWWWLWWWFCHHGDKMSRGRGSRCWAVREWRSSSFSSLFLSSSSSPPPFPLLLYSFLDGPVGARMHERRGGCFYGGQNSNVGPRDFWPRAFKSGTMTGTDLSNKRVDFFVLPF